MQPSQIKPHQGPLACIKLRCPCSISPKRLIEEPPSSQKFGVSWRDLNTALAKIAYELFQKIISSNLSDACADDITCRHHNTYIKKTNKMLWNNRAVLYNAVAVVARLSTASSFAPMALTTRTFAQTTSLYSAPPKRYLLNYEYIPDVLEKVRLRICIINDIFDLDVRA